MHEKGVCWMLRELAEGRQMKAHAFRVPTHHHIQSKLDKSRLAQLHLDFIADYSLICRPMRHIKVLTPISFASSSSKSATKVVQFWRTSSLKESITCRKVLSICVSLDYLLVPNHQDATTFFLIDDVKGLFYFDTSLRANSPSEEGNQVILSDKQRLMSKSLTRLENQTLGFMHSQKETVKLAKLLRDMAVEEAITHFVKADGAVQEILTEEANNIKGSNLRDLLTFGLGIHHTRKIILCWKSHLWMDFFRFSCVMQC